MDKERIWRWFLIAGFAMQIPLGLSVALGYGTPLWRWHRQRLAQSLWGTAEIPEVAMPAVDQLCAMLGATMACWAVAMLWVVCIPLARGERWAWWCIASSTASWFVVDTGLSLAHGVMVNVAFNVAATAMIGAPLVGLRAISRSTEAERGQA